MDRQCVVDRGRGVDDTFWEINDITRTHFHLFARQLGVIECVVNPSAAKRTAPLELEHLDPVALRHAGTSQSIIQNGRAHVPALGALNL